jgi:2-oxoisovalerate dehydrogenase E1 component
MKHIDLYKEAILIRRVEETFLELFTEGKLNGTVHTCVGQEFSAVAFAGQLQDGDVIFSNHRCHGHYLSFTKDYEGLIAELMGKETGTCGGVGSSQHLCRSNFFSNGIQGGIVPVAAGMALANKLKKNGAIGIVFIGDGTLGQGVVYETMNIASKWGIPLLIVLENNKYSQSALQENVLAGDILTRADAFEIKTAHSDTWNIDELVQSASKSINYVRNNMKPMFHLVDTYRLKPHSKGDDNRDKEEIAKYYECDPIVLFSKLHKDIYQDIVSEINHKITDCIDAIVDNCELDISKYYDTPSVDDHETEWSKLEVIDERQVDLINKFFDRYLAEDSSMLVIGEDVLSPYGGAFKVTKNLSFKYPNQVLSTPISEQAITGISNGLALAGMKPYLEIMFGDFITLALDQIINHASKFYHMYNKQISCPVVIRTPMGGGRGYGPTHSQTLDKFLIGIDNVTTIALNTLLDPTVLYKQIYEEQHPCIVIENKLDYGRKINKTIIPNYVFEKSDHDYPLVRVRPGVSKPTVTIVTYGGITNTVLKTIPELFYELDLIPEVFVISKIHPLDIADIADSVKQTEKVFIVEESSGFAGVGSEIIAHLKETIDDYFIARRISSLPVPIASSKTLEAEILTNSERIINTIKGAII